MAVNGATNFYKRAGKQLDDTFDKTYMSSLPKLVRGFQYVKHITGEIPISFVNAAGTGIVATAVIANNPLSKEDKDTKRYSALRQPVSAVLAILMQLGVILPFNHFVQSLSDRGYLPQWMNRVVVHDNRAIEKEIKKKNPKISKKDLAEAVKEQRQKEYAAAMEQISEKGTLSFKDHQMTTDNFKKLLNATSDDLMKETTAMLQHFEETLTKKYVERMTFFRDNDEAMTSLFKEIKENISGGKSQEETKKFFKELTKKHAKSNPIIKEIIEEISGGQNTQIKQTILEKIEKRFSDIKTQHLNTDDAIRTYVANSLKEQINSAQDDKKALTEIQKLISEMDDNNYKSKVKEIVRKSEELLKNGKDFLFNVVDKEVQITNRRFRSYKDGMGLIVGLITLPITCKMLNWLHPRFMEKCFPSIANSKNKKKEDKK